MLLSADKRLAYQKARSVFFGSCQFSRTDKLTAAKYLREAIRSFSDCASTSIDIADYAICAVRQKLQIERSIRNLHRRRQAHDDPSLIPGVTPASLYKRKASFLFDN